jgi:hypothetical protein
VRRAAIAIAVASLVSSCSYDVAFEDCKVACQSSDDCPADFTCGAEGRCRPAGGAGSCAELLGDAGGDDGSGARCTGTPAACATLIPMSDCENQTGCTYSTSTCTRTIDCTTLNNPQCIAANGCQPDVTMTMCMDIPGYCHGLDENACETLHAPGECVFAGGCEGTPNSCESHLDSLSCSQTEGCDFNFQ